ncbi:MAG TPA: hypothetical protein VK631_00255, partial [Solirubrobacteraceae bacterium]|nr:hypothetical protein [Solirubrobacteraceae bacterium]
MGVMLVLGGASAAQAQGIPPAGAECDGSSGTWQHHVLLFGKTSGTRNTEAIEAGRSAVCAAAGGAGIAVAYTEDATVFGDQLAGFDAVVFLHN